MLHYVDTRQGTNNKHSYSNGNTLPYTGVPFGMNHFVVQTNDEGSWFFNPNDRIFQGIRLTHQPSPWMGDFAHFLMTPIADDKIRGSVFSCQSSYRPEEAIFKPHYVKVKQQRYNITTELVPSCYGASLRIKYNGAQQAGFVLNAKKKSEFHLDALNRTITGYVSNFSGSHDDGLRMYVAMTFNKDIDLAHSGHYNAEGNLINVSTLLGEDQHAVIRFADCEKGTLEVKLATSFISIEQAQLNLQRDTSTTFDELKEQAAYSWNHYLNKIQVTHSNEEYLRTFYTCLYRMFLFPQKFYELDTNMNPVHYDTTARSVKEGILYTNNGFWDTYKTVYPLYSIIAPKEYEEMLEGFMNSYRETGFLPKWLSPDERGLMPGTLIDAVIADAATKGIGQHLMPELLEAMLTAATTQSEKSCYGRQGTLDYIKHGYVPSSYHESVNHTLDYAYSDYCISRVAEVLGNKEIQDHYRQSALNYRNIFDPKTGFMRAKDHNGQFRPDFNDTSWGLDYAEGSAWQTSFAVFQDFEGLIKAYGSKEQFFNKITELCNKAPDFDVLGYGFEIHEMSEMAAVDFGQVAISNQPSFHIPYLFNYVGQPASSQVVIKQILTNLFNSGFDGFPGDEDNGSMSGWYVFSSMGFYPVSPGSKEYVLGIPLFDSVSIELPNGQHMQIHTENNNTQSNFVANVTLENEEYTKLYITHDDIMEGKSLDFRLGLAPTYRTYGPEELPFSISKSNG
ncbi:GH92 family glycosyl hydrolase [Paenibacillus antarcticus]|uniref:Alpha-mannosidase n=1 Tax=Paenibacillus antarcticus TaxID=253703 RepID=A0A168P4J6_9BACL|nr:GH92 family glycosyl hydrolase [Paenibacillus antarcticus]OAB46379.1 alpha-mannosidase [Paenibacillus antarcticus]